MQTKPRILVAPLDWGIGHSTRCVPIIKELMRQEADVVIASNGRPLKVLEREFPDLPSYKLPPYDVRYPFRSIVLNMLLQMPRLLWTTWAEHRQVDQMIDHLHLDGIISDNRMGCFSRKVPTVVISHQLNVKAPSKFLYRLTNLMNHWYLRHYDHCWVPDWAGENNLSGELSRPSPLANTSYIGPITRLKAVKVDPAYDVLALLSGPEPQRTNLEKVILRQAASLPYKFLVVQGKPEASEQPERHAHIDVAPFLDAPALSNAIAESRMVICRSGYSTLMDLAALGKKALLIPTPGQTEQEYLAEFLMGKGSFVWQDQKEIDLAKGIAEVMALPEPDVSQIDTQLLEKAVREFLFATASMRRQVDLVTA